MKKVLLAAVASALLVTSCSQEEDDAPYRIGPKTILYCGVNGYFDCYKNDISKEEHYKCKFVLDVPAE